MKQLQILLLILLPSIYSIAQTTPFEQSGGAKTATYTEAIALYRQFDKQSAKVSLREMGPTDAGYPLHLVLVSNDGKTDPAAWKAAGKIVVMVNNGIHPGEPDGIDASLMLVRDIISGKAMLPDNVVLGIIPVYNIGGSLNRSSFSRVNQNGPEAYGFRGNAQNLDLNRDFVKADSREAQSFAEIFQLLQPNILIDNHVSDGADFQHVFTLLTTQYDKLGEPLGSYLRRNFEPSLYKGMKQKGWDLFPYVNFDAYDLSKGMVQFYDPPRYSSGYAALFGTIGFVPETHMLKPYPERVKSTYDFMVTVIEQASVQAAALSNARRQWQTNLQQQTQLPLGWKPNKQKADTLTFLGYGRDTSISEVTGLLAMKYNRSKTFSAPVAFYDYFNADSMIEVPRFYAIGQGWHSVIERLQKNKVMMRQLANDTTIEASVFMIDEYQTQQRAYEKHYRHFGVKGHYVKQKIKLLKGDYLIASSQPAKRYLFETLSPTGDDGFFAWNHFDAILQQKEGYSDYRWEEVAAQWLQQNPALKKELEEKKAADPAFAKNSGAILNWVYKRSPWYEPAHMRYPVFMIH